MAARGARGSQPRRFSCGDPRGLLDGDRPHGGNQLAAGRSFAHPARIAEADRQNQHRIRATGAIDPAVRAGLVRLSSGNRDGLGRRCAAAGDTGMPSFLDSRDTRYVLGALALMVILLAITYSFGPSPAPQSYGYPSSYAADWTGAKAAYLLLEDQRYHVEPWEKSPEELPAARAGDVLVIVDPFEGVSANEVAAIRRFVVDGGRIVAIGAEARRV